ncbi:MAG: ATP-grasp domain-containing protein [Candidatus Heimdallarchaeota archaeon]|nr:ATP-grasp domain-containing protein [Candidatus Heimdallarchaeota archaeon]
MKIFIQEFVSGGGFSNQELDANLLVEGFGMLRVLIHNCKKLGYEITSTLDSRIKFLSPFLETDQLIKIANNDSFIEKGKKLLQNADYYIIIAPETSQILSNIITEYSNFSSQSLNCETKTIDFATDKSQVYEFCLKRGITIPKTIKRSIDGSCWLLENGQLKKKIEEITEYQKYAINYPLIIKPNDGVACEGLKLCNTEEELLLALKENCSREMLIQEYILGDNLSITAYVWKGQIDILAINKQIISLSADKSEYLGGISNIKHMLLKDINTFCLELLSKIDGLQGFIGIDLIASKSDKNKREIFLIEINPRATTPICGLMNQNNKPIDLLPKSGEQHFSKQFDVTYFAKVKYNFQSPPNYQLYMNLMNNPAIITPPISFDGANIYSLLRGSGKNARKANENFNEELAILSNKLKNEILAR